MQAIVTKFLPSTGPRGSRIKAKCHGGSVIIDYPHDVAGGFEGRHRHAAEALCKKMGWDKAETLIAAGLPNVPRGANQWVFVFPENNGWTELVEACKLLLAAPSLNQDELHPEDLQAIQTAERVLHHINFIERCKGARP